MNVVAHARTGLALALVCLLGRAASAEPRHAVYVDMLGKGGLWGLGYEYEATPRLAFGAVGSYYFAGGDHHLSLSPYVAAYPLVRGHHRLFVQLGPQVVRRVTPSPVPEWGGMTTTRVGAELSSGYEYRNHVLVRVYGMASVGEHASPWLGVSLGWMR
ncbi:MAG: hypothetical protein H6Q90_4899 [Deltaproteobacteria bacterium]|nr:hypothetical protein [Deltaproteobacteria bacterium]